jgi:isocitrate dehydrogenase (NAD+)
MHADGVRVYEAIYGGSREAIGADRANPLPLILPAIEMLKDLGAADAAGRILRAVEAVLTGGKTRTADLGGTAGTAEFTDALIRAMDGRPA